MTKPKRKRRKSASFYRQSIEELGLNQTDAAEFLGINPRTSRRFASGDWPLPRSIAMLLAIMAKEGITPDRAKSLV